MSAKSVIELADVNVLLALLWPKHAHHAAAQAWFAADGFSGWASNAITQLGALRLLTNDAVAKGTVSASRALNVVAEATAHPGHQFWPLDKPVAPVMRGYEADLAGHRHWPDLLLLREAVRRGGKLVTFDSGIAKFAGKDARAHLLVLKG